jgi:hypothetical protein
MGPILPAAVPGTIRQTPTSFCLAKDKKRSDNVKKIKDKLSLCWERSAASKHE